MAVFFHKYPLQIIFSLIVLICGSTYLLTLAPDTSWGDSSEFILAVHSLGVPHPTGYPLYIILGKIFTLIIPLGSPAFKLNLLSAVFASFSIGIWYSCVWYWLSDGGKKESYIYHVSAASSGLILAWSSTFWSQSVITEVYTLAILFFVSITWFCLKWWYTGSIFSLRWILVLSGLALAHHLLVVFIFPGIAWIIYKGSKKHGKIPHLSNSLLLIPGLLFYLYLPMRANTDPILNWGSTQTLDGFITHISGGQFKLFTFSFLQGPLGPFIYLGKCITAAALLEYKEFFIFSIFILIGIIRMWKQKSSPNVLILSAPIFLTLFLRGYSVGDVFIFFIMVYCFTQMWLAQGIALLLESLNKKISKNLYILFCVVILLMPLIWLRSNFADIKNTNTDEVYKFGEFIMDQLPENSVILTDGDNQIYPLWYQKYVCGKRPDVSIIGANFLSSPWYEPMLKREGIDADLPSEIFPDEESWLKAIHEKILIPSHDLPIYSLQIFPFPPDRYKVSFQPVGRFKINYHNQPDFYAKFLPTGYLFRVDMNGK